MTEEEYARLIRDKKAELVTLYAQFVDTFAKPPSGINVITVDSPWVDKPDERTQEFEILVPTDDDSRLLTNFRISHIRATTGPAAQGIMITNTEIDVTSSMGGHSKGWGQTILPDGSLEGYNNIRHETPEELDVINN